jgi:hypothetical protein
MDFTALVPLGRHIGSGPGEGYLLNKNIKAKEGCDVTSSWDKASLYALWTRVSSGTSLFCDMVVASAVSIFECFRFCVPWTSSDGQRGWNTIESVVSASYFVA